MGQNVKYSLFSATTLILFFILAEGVSRFLFIHPGTCDFIERRIIEQGLTPQKSGNEFRIFLCGESTMQGDALYPKSTIEKWILIYLKDVLRKDVVKRVKIYNLARLGSNSRFITRSFLATLPYKPDLVVFYTAHNDFVQLDNRHSGFDPQPLAFGDKGFSKELIRRVIKQSAFLSEITRCYIRLKIERHKREDRDKKDDLPEIETIDKHYDARYDAINRESYKFKTILSNWVTNINTVIHAAQKRQVPLIFLSGVANYKEYPPNESVHQAGLDRETLSQWAAYHARADRRMADGNFKKALGLYQKALRLDPEYALTYYRLGQCYENLSQFKKANDYYQAANDKDRVPLRAPSEVNQFYKSLDEEKLSGVTVIRSQELFEKSLPHGIVDGRLLLDTMHPSIEGQALIALEIVKSIYDHEWLAPKELWAWHDLGPTQDYEKHLGLDEDFEFSVYLKKAIFVGRFYDKAIEYSKKALQIKPDSIEAKRQLAWTYWRKGDRDEAIRLYEEIYEQSPITCIEIMRKNPEISGKMFLARRRLGRRLIPQITRPL